MKNKNKLAKLRECVCIICNKHFYKHISPSEILLGRGIVCSKECKGILNGRNKRNGFYKICKKCKKEFWVSYSKEKYHHPRYCSRKCVYPTEPGKSLSTDGYYIKNGKKIHRIIMEEKIGRKLLSSEIVHHINEDKLDNRLENLQLMTRKEHNKLHFGIDDGLTNYQRFKLRHKK